MRKYILLSSILIAAFTGQNLVHAQQDPMFTKYMFNPLNYNPAYAGSAGALDLVLLHRHQWWGIKGAPMTQNFTLHSPIKNKNIGVGLNASFDQVAVSRQFNAYGSFAYRIPFGPVGKSGKLSDGGGYVSLGLQGGISNWTADWTELNIDDPRDPSFQLNDRPNLWLPNFGAGIYVYTRTWYVGFAAPMLIDNVLRKRSPNENPDIPIAQQYRHYYLSGGGVIKLGQVKLRPSVLIKNVGLFLEQNNISKELIGAPTEFDIDLALLFNNFFWVGTSFRSSFEFFGGTSSYDSVDFWLSLRLKNGLRIGAAYDFTLTQLQGPAQGSYELILGYDLIRLVDQVDHVRYF